MQKTLEEESDEWLRLMATGLKQLDADKVTAAAAALQANPRGRDIKLLELAIPALGQAKAYSKPGNRQWTQARLQLAQLLRISTIRLAIRRQGLEPSQLTRLLTGLKSALKQAESIENLDIDLEAEIRCTRTVLKSLNSPFWSGLQTTLPSLADFRNSSDPAYVLQPLFPLFSPENPTQTRILASILMLTIMRHARKYLSLAANTQLKELITRTQAWTIAILLNRLISECLEEQELQLDVRSQMGLILTEDLMSLKERYMWKNWKVRKSAIRIARKICEISKEQGTIEKGIVNRVVLEGDELVRIELPLLKPEIALESCEAERELRCGCMLIHHFYTIIHDNKDKLQKIAEEIEHLAQSIDHLATLVDDLEGITRLVASAKVEINRIRRIAGNPSEYVKFSKNSKEIVGREEIITDLVALLRSKPAKIAILGGPGSGKTALVRALIPFLEPQYTKICWLNSKNSLTLTNSLSSPQPAVIRADFRSNPTHLLIYDSADFQDSVASEIEALVSSLYDLHEAAVIVTSRSEEWVRYLPYCYHLSPYSTADTVKRLVTLSGLTEERIAGELVTSLKGNPGVVELAGRYLGLTEGFEPLERLLEVGKDPLAQLSTLLTAGLTSTGQLLAAALAYFNPAFIPMDIVTEIGTKLPIPNVNSVLKELEAADFLTIVPTGVEMDPILSTYTPCNSSIEALLSESLLSRLSSNSIAILVHSRHYRSKATLPCEALDQALLQYCLSHGLGTEAAIIARTAPASQATSSDAQVQFLFNQVNTSQQAGNWIEVQIAYLQVYNLLKSQRSITLFRVLVELAKVCSRLGETARAAKWVEEAVDLMPEIELEIGEKLEVCRLGVQLLHGRSERAVGLMRLGIELASKAASKPVTEQLALRLDLAEALLHQFKHEEGLLAILEFLRRATPASDPALIAKAFLLLASVKSVIQPERRAEILSKELELRRNSMDRSRLISILSELSHSQPSSHLSKYEGLAVPGNSTGYQTLALVRPRVMQLFDCLKLKFSPVIKLAGVVKVDHLSAYTVLKDFSVFICGGGEEKALYDSTYRVFSTGQVERLGNMIRARQAHGLAEWSGTIYAFGGETLDNLPFAYSENIEIEPLTSLSAQQWTRISSMLTARSCFAPCVFEDFIYLIGGNTTKAERFDPQLQHYESLPIELAESEDTCTVLSKDSEFITFSPNFCYHYTPFNGLVTTPRNLSASTHSTSPRQLLISAGNMRGISLDSWVYISIHDHIRAIDLLSSNEVVLLL
jgi:hypothetical protein